MVILLIFHLLRRSLWREERGLRLAMFESLELRFKKARSDTDMEAQERAAADQELNQKLKALSDEQGVRRQRPFS